MISSRAYVSQAPETGLMRRLLGSFHVTGVFWYRFHAWGVRVLPRWAVGPGILLFCSFMFVALRNVRRGIGGNLEVVLGPCGWLRRQVRIYRTMWNFAWCLSERYERLGTDRRVSFEIEGEEVWRDVVGDGSGFLLVTAHMGHWEVGSFFASSLDRRTVHVVREEEGDPKAQEFIRELIEGQGEQGYVVHFTRGDDPELGARLLMALRRSEIVALQSDRPRTGGRSLEVELFGRPFHLPFGPAALARATGSPMVPVFIFRQGRARSRVVVREPVVVARTADRDADVTAALQQIAGHVEWAIRQHPHQWFCFRRLWPATETA